MLIRASLVPPKEALDELWVATSALRKVPGVTVVAPTELEIPITAFGNLVPADSARLAAKLRSAIEGAEAPVVRFQGLRLEKGATIAVGLGGDIEPLGELARFVPEAAETMRLYVDRRRFQPRLTYASAEPDASPTLLEAAFEKLSEWRGEPWPVPGLSLLRTRWEEGTSVSEEYDLIALSRPSGPPDEES